MIVAFSGGFIQRRKLFVGVTEQRGAQVSYTCNSHPSSDNGFAGHYGRPVNTCTYTRLLAHIYTKQIWFVRFKGKSSCKPVQYFQQINKSIHSELQADRKETSTY